MAATKLGILGAGNSGMVHLQSARVTDGVDVTAAADPVDSHRARARKWGAQRTYDDYETLLANERLDAAVVALPPFLHADALERAADAGVDVFVETPFARNAAEAQRMTETATQAGIRVGVNHTTRYMPHVRAVKRAYDAGEVGHVPICELSHFTNGPYAAPPANEPISDWQLDADATGGGVLLDLGVRLFDIVDWLFGDATVVAASTSRQLDVPYEDAATVVLESGQTGTTATATCGFFQWEEPPELNMGVRLEGIAGTLDSREHEPSNFSVHSARSALRNVERRLGGTELAYFEPSYYYQAHYRALEAFLDAVHAGRTPPVNETHGRRTAEQVERAYALAEDSSQTEVADEISIRN